jgi:hypothetical protein
MSSLRLSILAFAAPGVLLVSCGAEGDVDSLPTPAESAATPNGASTESADDGTPGAGANDGEATTAASSIVAAQPSSPTCLASSSPPACRAADAASSIHTPQSLPDLVLDGEYLRATIIEGVVDASQDMCLFAEGCVTGTGLRRVIRFGTRSGNIGTSDLVIGRPEEGSPLWELDACHGHFHFEGYAQYDLVDSATSAILPIGVKHGFCLRDQEAWDPELSNGSGGCTAYDCDYQGMTAGCADVYKADLDCQWVDITDVPAGAYRLRVSINYESGLEELSYANNTASVSLQITEDDVVLLP